MAPGVALLQKVLAQTSLPVWINADVLPGPGGQAQPLDPQAFLSALRGLPPHTVLSLGWTTGWSAGSSNPGETLGSQASHVQKQEMFTAAASGWSGATLEDERFKSCQQSGSTSDIHLKGEVLLIDA